MPKTIQTSDDSVASRTVFWTLSKKILVAAPTPPQLPFGACNRHAHVHDISLLDSHPDSCHLPILGASSHFVSTQRPVSRIQDCSHYVAPRYSQHCEREGYTRHGRVTTTYNRTNRLICHLPAFSFSFTIEASRRPIALPVLHRTHVLRHVGNRLLCRTTTVKRCPRASSR